MYSEKSKRLKAQLCIFSLMLEGILDSRAKMKIMKLLSRFPKRQFQAIEVAGLAKLSVSRTSECLKEFVDKEILKSRKIGKGYLFELDTSSYLTKIILEVFNKERNIVKLITNEFVSQIKRYNVKSVVLFGSASRELTVGSDIDILVVSDKLLHRDAVSRITSDLTVKYGFPVSCLVMTTSELKKKAKIREDFVINLIASGKLLYGKDLEELTYGKRS